MRYIVIPGLLLALAACDSPSLAYRRAPATQVAVEGMRFTVRQRGARAEAIRTSREVRPSRSGVEARAERAIEIATGCKVGAIEGDVSIQLAKLDC